MKSSSPVAFLAAFMSRRLAFLLVLAVVLPWLGASTAPAQTNGPGQAGQRRGPRALPDPKTLPPPKHAVIPKLAGPVKIDGELDEAVWGKAVVLEPFFQNEGSAGPELEHTQVRLWYDDAALYLGWKCMDADIHATFTNRDSHFWEEECVEFFVTPKALTNTMKSNGTR